MINVVLAYFRDFFLVVPCWRVWVCIVTTPVRPLRLIVMWYASKTVVLDEDRFDVEAADVSNPWFSHAQMYMLSLHVPFHVVLIRASLPRPLRYEPPRSSSFLQFLAKAVKSVFCVIRCASGVFAVLKEGEPPTTHIQSLGFAFPSCVSSSVLSCNFLVHARDSCDHLLRITVPFFQVQRLLGGIAHVFEGQLHSRRCHPSGTVRGFWQLFGTGKTNTGSVGSCRPRSACRAFPLPLYYVFFAVRLFCLSCVVQQ